MIETSSELKTEEMSRPRVWTVDPEADRRFRKKTRFADNLARWVISAAGMGIIAAIMGIGVFLFSVVVPLVLGAKVELLNAYPLIDVPQVHHVFIDENQKKMGVLGVSPWLEVRSTTPISGQAVETMPIPGLEGELLTVVRVQNGSPYAAIGTQSGRVWLGELDFNTRFEGSTKVIDAVIEKSVVLNVFKRPLPIDDVSAFWSESGGILAATAEKRVVVVHITQRKPLIGPMVTEKNQVELDLSQLPGNPTRVLVADNASQLYVATDTGYVGRWRLSAFDQLAMAESVQVISKGAVSHIEALLGNRSFVIGGSDGSVSGWSLVKTDKVADGKSLTKLHTLKSHSGAVRLITPSPRGKSLITVDEGGQLYLQHMTTHRLLKKIHLKEGVQSISFAPKANGMVLVSKDNKLQHWNVYNPHPDMSLKTLFTKVWYEGHAKPKHSWQSHGSTDDFEPKFGLMPLLFGTLKGTFYAMLFSIPIAVIGALYTSQFLNTRLRASVKSAIEVMAALPSVVLGFIAGLVLAPFVEEHIIAVMSMGVIVPGSAMLGMWAIHSIQIDFVKTFRRNHQFWALIMCLLLGFWISFLLGPPIENLLFAGDFQGWLYNTLNIRYDQRNSLVVGIVMGFAVIPIIFTICEDAFSSVPAHLVAASLACGATAWQTAIQVVLPAAGSGVFSALMVGFGRAIGETMIVLMATGNTPIMDGSIFNGFRALSANIAVEIPEAPIGGTHYRVLFLTALLLFCMTFIVNTIAEVVRSRLRRNLSGV